MLQGQPPEPFRSFVRTDGDVIAAAAASVYPYLHLLKTLHSVYRQRASDLGVADGAVLPLLARALLAQGKTVTETCKQLGVTEQTYYRWRKEYGGMKVDQAKRLKELEAENARLKRAGLDYHEYAQVSRHASLQGCMEQIQPQRLFGFSTHGKRNVF